jgi:ornithine cyclodeaminase/alanine dehydrogenase-like protein (mu-crystallin family)
MTEALAAVEAAFGELERGTADVPLRHIILVPEQDGDCFFMPGYLREAGAFGTKISPFFPENPGKHDLPASVPLMVLLDVETGVPAAVMDADVITAVRTGATSGVAAKYLSREDTRHVAIIGTGQQAGTQLEAVCGVRDVERVSVNSIAPREQQVAFAEEMSRRLGLEIEVRDSARQAVEGAGIVLLATTASEPVIRAEWLDPGAHVSSIQTTGPGNREVGSDVVTRAKIVCDSREACLEEAGELLLPIGNDELSPEDVHANLGELVLGRKPGRQSEDELTFFKTVGLAIEDLAVARLALDRAGNEGIGQQFDFTA